LGTSEKKAIERKKHLDLLKFIEEIGNVARISWLELGFSPPVRVNIIY